MRVFVCMCGQVWVVGAWVGLGVHVYVSSMTHVHGGLRSRVKRHKCNTTAVQGTKCDLQMYLRTYIPVFFAD